MPTDRVVNNNNKAIGATGSNKGAGARVNNGARPNGDRSASGNRPNGSRPSGDRSAGGNRPNGNRPSGDRRASGNRPNGNRANGDRNANGNRPNGNRPSGDRSASGNRPNGSRPNGGAKPRTMPTARKIALKVINQVLADGAYTNIALNKVLRDIELPEVERRFATELVYGTIKAKGTLDWVLEQFVSRPLSSLEPIIVNILRLGVYQLLYLERVPASAACNESANLTKHFAHDGIVKFVNGVLRNVARQADKLQYPTLEEDKYLHLALTQCHPLWLAKRWIKAYGYEEAEALCRFDNTVPTLTLRANTLTTTRGGLLSRLIEAGFEAEPSTWSEDGIVCTKIPSLGVLFARFNHDFYIQDESSMLVAAALDPKPGDRVLDACSAPGGKATHVAALMHNQGAVVACDIHPHKLELIRENSTRLGIACLQAVEQDGSVFKEQWEEAFDKVIVDAPCSGLGVLRRRAEARWTKTKKDLKQFPVMQRDILNNCSKYVKVGGRLVYSTCTIEQCENHYIVAEFLENHPGWEYAGFAHPKTGETIKELQLYPQKDGIDGFYLSVLQRKE